MAKDAKNNKDVKSKKHFFKDFKAELKKVIWPTPKQIVNSTIAVITIVLITAAIVFVLDFAFKMLNEQGIDKLKANIKDKVVVENVIQDGTEGIEINSVDNTENAEQNNNNEVTVENESSVENVQ